MEHKVGKVFKWRGLTLQVEQTLLESCNGCFFFEDGFCTAFEYEGLEGRARRYRKDENNVVFRLIKKG